MFLFKIQTYAFIGPSGTGKSYTIAQYKRMIGCVYETARTAMDHLVELGYYRKDSSNKKFIYTPIPRK